MLGGSLAASRTRVSRKRAGTSVKLGDVADLRVISVSLGFISGIFGTSGFRLDRDLHTYNIDRQSRGTWGGESGVTECNNRVIF